MKIDKIMNGTGKENFTVNVQLVETVKEYVYWGTVIIENNDYKSYYVRTRIGKALNTFDKMKSLLFCCSVPVTEDTFHQVLCVQVYFCTA